MRRHLKKRVRRNDPPWPRCEPCAKTLLPDIATAIRRSLAWSKRNGRPYAFYPCPADATAGFHLTRKKPRE